MSEKWTKEQIEEAKKIEKDTCAGISCDDCPININNTCCIGRVSQLIQQHEHDADEEKRPNPLNDTDKWIDMSGMTLTGQTPHDFWRYMFAGMAMHGLCSNPEIASNSEKGFDYQRCAVQMADALLEKLEEK